MNGASHNTIVNFIWNIADDVLRDVYVRGKYRDVILPMTVIRRLDSLLESTKDDVLKQKELLDKAGIANQEAALRQASGQAFYNMSEFTLKTLLDNPKQLRSNFNAYLDGFSGNVQEIIDKFDFRNQLKKLEDADALGYLIEKFISPAINLSPKPVMDGAGNEKFPALDNHGMGYVFEELIRRFNEENNEEAGEHFTPREVVKLMANLIFMPIADKIENSTYLVYDCACGTGGMLTVSDAVLSELAEEHSKNVSIHLYGQEINAETYAICKADLLLKGEGAEADNIRFGSTISSDNFPSNEFHFMLANPPYGKSWKTDLDRLCGGNKKEIKDHRFVVEHGGDSEFSLVTRSSDGQLMFLVNMLSKMKSPETTPFGSRVATVHNGSSLFTGDAGQGESNIRRWIIENDWLEAIIALPENMFYNTGIATYIWLLSNKKDKNRKGRVQLINATEWYSPLRKNLGKKNCEFTDDHIQKICQLVSKPKETEQSKIFPNEAFGYWKFTVERPLRLKADFSKENMERFRQYCESVNDEPLAEFVERVVKRFGVGPHLNFNDFLRSIKEDAEEQNIKLTTKRFKAIRSELTIIDEGAEPVIKKIHKSSKTVPNPKYGLFETVIDGKIRVVEYEPDTNLRDSEQASLLEEGGIEAFFEREVLLYVPDAWIDESSTKIGYEISFTRYFYKPVPLRTLEEIKADIFALESETEGLLEEIIGEAD